MLLPGKGGIDPADPLLRNRAALNARGIATLTVPHDTRLGQAIEYMRRIKDAGRADRHERRRAARGVGLGAKPDMLVLISGSLMAPGMLPAQEPLKTPGVLPPTLVMANRNDPAARRRSPRSSRSSPGPAVAPPCNGPAAAGATPAAAGLAPRPRTA